ncbi:copper amine oxidase-like protein [Paenibacillus cellulosilyticus]|uniref:Copper amine oxidase-like protein n=1 Tax=Paenibacillus cellulosilyticus TaxID=375489 RepID=A0A2V2YQ52_9BACL|nr:NlpC/P60 family protein [Paenibacillus cellulosilyticus]PWV98641.1 copper amine oxidase-like protein [Paenibacillus cellulosilyticus]QKS43845.1 C40 family peptidase [Paenibacillus cellulosilyticus]
MSTIYLSAKYYVLLTAACGALLLTSGCGSIDKGQSQPSPSALAKRSARIMAADSSISSRRIPVLEERLNGRVWIPLDEAVSPLGLRLHETTGGRTAIGDMDAVYSVRANQTDAMSGDTKVELLDAPRRMNGELYMTPRALSSLLQTDVKWDDRTSDLRIRMMDDRYNTGVKPGSEQGQQQGLSGSGIMPLGLVDIDPMAVVRYAKTFLGTPYEFDADIYSKSHRFDCSSFTKYVYDRFGVKLPRSSRAQSALGKRVGLEELQPADLMFFYTPGRYETNKAVGHVGMYVGGGKFIQTYGDPGVVMTSLNGYWKGRFLFGKRVAR